MELLELSSRLCKLEEIIQELAKWTGFQIKEKIPSVKSHTGITIADPNGSGNGNIDITSEYHETSNNSVAGPSADSEVNVQLNEEVAAFFVKVELEEGQEGHVDVDLEQCAESVHSESSSVHATVPKYEIDEDFLSKTSGKVDPLVNLDNSYSCQELQPGFSDTGENSSPESDVKEPPKKRRRLRACRTSRTAASARCTYEPLSVPPKSSLPPTPPFVIMKKLTPSQISSLSHRNRAPSKVRRYRTRTSNNSQFSCYFCFKSFATEHQMRTHLRLSHTKERPFRCSKCSFSTIGMRKLKVHIYGAHEKTDFFKCPVCPVQMKNLQGFAIHIRTHPNFTFKCASCPFTTTTVDKLRRHEWGKHVEREVFSCPQCPQLKIEFKSVLERHLRTHTGERPFPCPHCSYAANTMGDLNSHLRSMHPATEEEEFHRPFLCDQCPKPFKSKGALQLHITEHHRETEKNFRCDFCPFLSKSRGNLTAHLKRAHGGKDLRFKCYFCSSICKCYQALTKHLGIHTGEKPYKCSHCPYKTNDFSTLKRHIKRLHSTQTNDSTNKALLKCPKCPCKLTTQSGLINHLKTHYKHKHKCGICEYEAPNANSLKKHYDENHKEGKELKCPHCPKTFHTKSNYNVNLLQHLRMHSGEKPFKCGKCQYATGHKSNFMKHEKICKGKGRKETPGKMFKCDKCEQEFTSLGNVNRHMAKWHGKNLLQCPHCNHNFKDEKKLRDHVKIRHTEKSSTDQMEVIPEEPETHADVPAIWGMKDEIISDTLC